MYLHGTWTKERLQRLMHGPLLPHILHLFHWKIAARRHRVGRFRSRLPVQYFMTYALASLDLPRVPIHTVNIAVMRLSPRKLIVP